MVNVASSELSLDDVASAWCLLDALPFPVMLIADDYMVLRINQSAVYEYGSELEHCYDVHGYNSSCDRHGEMCPKLEVMRRHQLASVLHVHQTQAGTKRYKITALPVKEGGILEFHIPLDDVTAVDLLTGLLNRAEGEQSARRSVALMYRMRSQYSVLMIDLDYFKRVNDTYGHPVGDQVLSTAAKVITSNIRQTDTAIRWGGEEFLVLLPDTDASQAVNLAQRLIDDIRRLNIEVNGQVVGITASAGIRYISSEDLKKVSFDDAVSDSDKALYQAKHAGRDRVKLYGAESD